MYIKITQTLSIALKGAILKDYNCIETMWISKHLKLINVLLLPTMTELYYSRKFTGYFSVNICALIFSKMFYVCS